MQCSKPGHRASSCLVVVADAVVVVAVLPPTFFTRVSTGLVMITNAVMIVWAGPVVVVDCHQDDDDYDRDHDSDSCDDV